MRRSLTLTAGCAELDCPGEDMCISNSRISTARDSTPTMFRSFSMSTATEVWEANFKMRNRSLRWAGEDHRHGRTNDTMRIAAIGGDGIGPEVTAQACHVLAAVAPELAVDNFDL